MSSGFREQRAGQPPRRARSTRFCSHLCWALCLSTFSLLSSAAPLVTAVPPLTAEQPDTAAPAAVPAQVSSAASTLQHPFGDLPFGAASAAPNKNRAASVANYRLSARLDPQERRILGSGTLQFVNLSAAPLQELYFHLYLNAFEGSHTLYLRGSRPGGRSGGVTGRPGKIEIRRLSSSRYGEQNLWEQADPHSPGDPQDRTDIRVPLPTALLPGETLELQLEFESFLPEIIERTGFARDFYLIAQWYPKLARLEPEGRWAHFAYHPFGEYYADFGEYDIELTVPSSYVVGSSGVLEILREEAGHHVYRAQAHSVHDFAWTAWPHFSPETRSIAGVHVTLLAGPPSATRHIRRVTWETLETALPLFQKQYGPYPYPQLTVVHPPYFAQRAGGMEYPTFITTGGKELTTALGFRHVHIVTAHELAHQWFQGLLASHEQEHPFLDEGLTSFAEWRALEKQLGPGSLFSSPLLQVSRIALGRTSAWTWRRDEIIAQPARDFSSFRSLSAHVYNRTALALETMHRVYGEEAGARALARYAAEHRFSHPTPDDFYAAWEAELGAAARRQLETLLSTPARLDYRVGRIFAEPPLQRVEILKQGPLEFPVEILLEFEQGPALLLTETFSQESQWLEVSSDSPLRLVHIDPHRKILYDHQLLNNRRYVDAAPPSQLQPRLTWWAYLLHQALRP